MKPPDVLDLKRKLNRSGFPLVPKYIPREFLEIRFFATEESESPQVRTANSAIALDVCQCTGIACCGCKKKLVAKQTSRSESIAIFLGGHEARHHPTWVVGRIQHRDPLQIEAVRLSPEIAKVFHHRISLMVVLRRDFCALDDLSQHLPTSHRRVVQAVNHRLPARQRHARS